MKQLNRNQWIAIFAGLAFLGYLLFAGPIMNLFTPNNNNLTDQTPQVPQSGFVSQDNVVGEGLVAEAGDVLTVHYVGTFTDGRVFDSSRDSNSPFSFTLGTGGVIRGWDEGLVGMKVGGRRTLVIAPDYGYGPQAVGSIPANSVLIFDVELLGIQKAN